EVVLVLENARNRSSIHRDDLNRLIAARNVRARLGQGFANRAESALRAHARKIGTGQPAASSDQVALAASALAREDLLAARHVSLHKGLEGGGPQTADVGDHLPGIIGRQTRGWHLGSGNAVADGLEQVVIGEPQIAAYAGQGGTAISDGPFE